LEKVKTRKMSVEIKNLDHLRLIAGIIDEIGIVDQINGLIEEKKTEKVSAGKVVKVMILNGIGLVSSPYIAIRP
jgi:hypothetical protein